MRVVCSSQSHFQQKWPNKSRIDLFKVVFKLKCHRKVLLNFWAFRKNGSYHVSFLTYIRVKTTHDWLFLAENDVILVKSVPNIKRNNGIIACKRFQCVKSFHVWLICQKWRHTSKMVQNFSKCLERFRRKLGLKTSSKGRKLFV